MADDPSPELTADEELAAWKVVTLAIDRLTPRVESLDDWNMGLFKMVLIQEWRWWHSFGRRQQAAGDQMTDHTRDQAAASMAFDTFVGVMPQSIQDVLKPGRDGIIEMLMDQAGHLPREN